MNELKKWSNINEVQKKAKKYLGNNVIIEPSTRKDKKYMVRDINNHIVHFGQMGYEDFTKHKDNDRRQNYLNRATNIKGDWKNNKYSPNNLSIHLLW